MDDPVYIAQRAAISTGDRDLLQAAWWALGYDNRAAFCTVSVGEQRRGREICEQWWKRHSKEAA